MSAHPLRAVFQALESAGCAPRGPEHDFRACCPAHEGDNPEALHVTEGVDGRALLHCFVGCDAQAVVRALGLSWSDLFPPGHRSARTPRGIGRPRDPIDLILKALLELGVSYRCARDTGLWVAERCPACGADKRYPLWVVNDARGRVGLSCFNGCEQHVVLDALAGKRAAS